MKTYTRYAALLCVCLSATAFSAGAQNQSSEVSEKDLSNAQVQSYNSDEPWLDGNEEWTDQEIEDYRRMTRCEKEAKAEQRVIFRLIYDVMFLFREQCLREAYPGYVEPRLREEEINRRGRINFQELFWPPQIPIELDRANIFPDCMASHRELYNKFIEDGRRTLREMEFRCMGWDI